MKPATPIVITATALSSSLAFAQMPMPGVVANPGNQNGDTEMRELISPPKTAADFIRNIKYSFDNNLFLDDRFFEKNAACKVFNISERSCAPQKTNQPDGSHDISIYSGNFIGIFPEEQIPIQPDSTQHHHPPLSTFISTAPISIYKKISPLGVVSGGIHFVARKDGPNFSEMTKILNSDLTQVIEMPPHGKIQIPITGAHGDETWKYEISTDKLTKRLVIGFHSDGTLESMLVEIDEVGGQQ
jgi:hypothetical protein